MKNNDKLTNAILIVTLGTSLAGLLLSGRIIFLVLVVYITWGIKQYKREVKKYIYNPNTENSKIVSAKVILVDNFHTPKKLICQFDGENGIVQYQKEKKDNFLEMVGDIVEVKVDVMNESRYEILDK